MVDSKIKRRLQKHLQVLIFCLIICIHWCRLDILKKVNPTVLVRFLIFSRRKSSDISMLPYTRFQACAFNTRPPLYLGLQITHKKMSYKSKSVLYIKSLHARFFQNILNSVRCFCRPNKYISCLWCGRFGLWYLFQRWPISFIRGAGFSPLLFTLPAEHCVTLLICKPFFIILTEHKPIFCRRISEP
jgi:hypothetical protein